jgi:hypothetical protein
MQSAFELFPKKIFKKVTDVRAPVFMRAARGSKV